MAAFLCASFSAGFKPVQTNKVCRAERRRILGRKGFRMSISVGTKTSVVFLPEKNITSASQGELLLDVALRAGALEEKHDAFCRDGGCYRCEMEVGGQLQRTCMCRVGDATLRHEDNGDLEVIKYAYNSGLQLRLVLKYISMENLLTMSL